MLTLLQNACKILVGHHDFSSFRAAGCQVFVSNFNVIYFQFLGIGYFFLLGFSAYAQCSTLALCICHHDMVNTMCCLLCVELDF